MCAIDDAEIFVKWERRERKAIKPHECSECRREIAKGETYHFEKGLLSGMGWESSKRCAHCEVGARWLVEECHGYCINQVREEIHEHAQDYHAKGLWRLVVGADRKWQRFDGAGLMPIPAMPPVSAPLARAA
jgi:hypothetical protein